MFLNNQKYWQVSYKYSDEFDAYIQSIKKFIINLIVTNKQEFQIIDISKYSSLEGVNSFTYLNDTNFEKIIQITLAEIFDELLNHLKITIDARLKEKFFGNKNCIYKYDKKIFYTKKSINEERSIIQKVNGSLRRDLKASINDDIITFIQQHLNNKTMNIVNVFLENKVLDIKLIEDDDKVKKVDFLPVKLSDVALEIEIEYDENTYNLSNLHLETINNIFGLSIPISEVIVSEAKYENKIIGLVIHNYIFFYDIYDLLRRKLLNKKIIKLAYLKKNILTDDSKSGFKSDIVDEFKSSISNKNILDALSLLEENIYLTENNFKYGRKRDTRTFFNLAYKVETQYLKKFQIFVPYIKEKKNAPIPSLFGLNNISNARDEDGNSEKGLKSWVNLNNEEQNSVRNEAVTDFNKVMHLLPELAFYFKEKFFEDLLKEILIEIKNENPSLSLEIIDNKKFFVNKNENIKSPLSVEADYTHNQEFDFILSYIKENGELSTIVLEAKTKLSKFIIQDQADKVEKYMLNDDLKIFDDYYLIGFNTADDVKSAMAYFIKNMSIDNCSGDMAFKYPLPSSNKNLYCISSNKRNVLKTNLLAILK